MQKLSVVVAAQDAGSLLKRCLASLVSQLPPDEMEVMVVTGPSGSQTELAREFPSVRFTATAVPVNVPKLWAQGIEMARAEIVALTIENCIPAPDWAKVVLAAHANPWPAIGGAIEPDPKAGLVDWAIYFCRYSGSMLPFPERFLDDLAADNVSYKRGAIDAVWTVARDGFWETLIHEAMRKRGEKLFSDPSLIVTFGGGISARRFLARRYHHGRYFAARRSEGFTTSQRLARAVGAPLVPLVLLNRMAGRIRRKGRYQLRFLACLPLIACFLTAWAVGEGTGYAAGYSTGNPIE
ncbi:MAG TPA: glycosyltransferase [Bryobacteraceae bacterium]